ncbi:glutathione S-transferase C-terminal domain-containing protein-like [Polyodon spathula]|uniref:glutathione S-transferase C-terminal domain-containing protein-like n=1 Tax=Polyodon spathula TaxID=7913 RepID=UPI001B7E6235|nr:glutathione S-transferase C-terminal domain-containing protein-like [Polyodon spathula]
MKHTNSNSIEECLYLAVSGQSEETVPLHTSIALFLLSYCESKSFRVCLVSSTTLAGEGQSWRQWLPEGMGFRMISTQELPQVIRSCRLPAVVDEGGRYCRAGLAVVLRHIIKRTLEADPCRKDVAELLGFKKTCLKACAEVSEWTRLCELSIPSAVEDFCRQPEHQSEIPTALLHLEKKLGEPVRVHNDDKIRRQKLQQKKGMPEAGHEGGLVDPKEGAAEDPQSSDQLELQAALAKLSMEEIQSATTRGPPHIRKVKTTELPSLEHVFAEGLYFTLTDVVLLPCLHQFLVSLVQKPGGMLERLPLLQRWYLHIQEVPGVRRAAISCGIHFLSLPEQGPAPNLEPQNPINHEEEKAVAPFTGGPRPTMTKLKNSGIEAIYSPHPCSSWALDWDGLPAAVNPMEGKMSKDRALRKRQQLNNLVAMVTKLAQPGNTVVDFCSGGGHVGIVLAHTLPACQVVLIENKEESLARAKNRCDELGLNNIWFIQANLDYFTGPFKIGVALHACGVATDMVMEHCIKAQAAFVISPCCYGFIQNTVKFTFPRSQQFMDVLSYKEHMVLCRFADQTEFQLPADRRLIGKQCMGLVDLDRAQAAERNNYSVKVMSMEPESCSPKNNMVVGVPADCKLI